MVTDTQGSLTRGNQKYMRKEPLRRRGRANYGMRVTSLASHDAYG